MVVCGKGGVVLEPGKDRGRLMKLIQWARIELRRFAHEPGSKLLTESLVVFQKDPTPLTRSFGHSSYTGTRLFSGLLYGRRCWWRAPKDTFHKHAAQQSQENACDPNYVQWCGPDLLTRGAATKAEVVGHAGKMPTKSCQGSLWSGRPLRVKLGWPVGSSAGFRASHT